MHLSVHLHIDQYNPCWSVSKIQSQSIKTCSDSWWIQKLIICPIRSIGAPHNNTYSHFIMSMLSILVPSNPRPQIPQVGSQREWNRSNPLLHHFPPFSSSVCLPSLHEGALPPPPPPPPPPPSLPPPPHNPFPPIYDVEEELLNITIWLDCGLHGFHAQGRVININHYTMLLPQLHTFDQTFSVASTTCCKHFKIYVVVD